MADSSVENRIDPWILSCESWMSQGKYIALPLNPEQLDFGVPLRVAHDDGYNAKFVYIWRRRHTHSMTNQSTLSFSLSSANVIPAFDISTPQAMALSSKYYGNIPGESVLADQRFGRSEYTQASVAGIYDRQVPIGVSNLYALLALADAPRIRVLNPVLDANGNETGQQASNRIVACISTMIFPRLLLYGWFTTDGISFSINADNPAEFTVTFSLLVTGSFPRLGQGAWKSLADSYANNMYAPMSTTDWLTANIGKNGIPKDGSTRMVDPTPIGTDESNQALLSTGASGGGGSSSTFGTSGNAATKLTQ